MTNLTLIGYFFFVIFLLIVSFLGSITLANNLPPIFAATFITLLFIILAFIMVKVLFAPLVQAGKNIDRIIKETLHELNIPLATIDANVKLLNKVIDEEKPKRQLERIKQASRHLLHLHKGLKYHINKEFAPTPLEMLELDTFLKERIDHYETIYPQAEFRVNLQKLTLMTDPHGLQQIIDNLIANAIKYARTKPMIEISIDHEELTILDHGKGMDQATLIHIFERYYQADRQISGQGIGLSVVKSFCDTHKIRLTLTSELGSFTKVVLNFASNLYQSNRK